MAEKFKSEFQEIKILGSGTFSTVFEARSNKNGKTYAIKKIPTTIKEKDNTMKEIEIISLLNDNFVVTYFDSWTEENYYVTTSALNVNNNDDYSNLYAADKTLLIHIQMELCSMSLNEFIAQMNRQKLNEVTVEEYSIICNLFAQLLECVNYLHVYNPPIIHRDLKPDNIMLIINNNHYKVKLTDFGLSTFHESIDQSHTKNIGTLSYRAPEVDSKSYGTKTDIYSIGKIMQKLFNIDVQSESNNNAMEIQSKYKTAKQICSKCLSFTPKLRPNCKKILSDKQMWFYHIEESDVSRDKSYKRNELLFDILNEKWPYFSKVHCNIMFNLKKIAIIEESENKAIIINSKGKIFPTILSEHIDTMKESKITSYSFDHDVQTIISGDEHVLFLTKDKHVYSFGNNRHGQLGVGNNINCNLPTIIEELIDYPILDIKCGAYHSLALCESGKLFTWGGGWLGQIGIGYNYLEKTPVEVNSFISVKIVSIACGYHYSLALSEVGVLYGWGYNAYGQLGIGNDSCQNNPVLIKFDDNVTVNKIRCGATHSLVLTTDNEIYSFGDNEEGQLGIGSKINQSRPTKIQTHINFNDIEAIFNKPFSIGKDIDNKYYIWGECNNEFLSTPTQTNFSSFNELVIYCLSGNNVNTTIQTSNVNFSDESTVRNKLIEWKILKYLEEKEIPYIISFSIIRLKESKAIFVTKDNMVYSFRLNESVDKTSDEPVIVNELSTKLIKNIICGMDHVLCLTENNEVYAFGDNYNGQLGDGSRSRNYKPTLITELSDKNILEISCGQYHCLALSESGRVFVWGGGWSGQNGIGEVSFCLKPVEVNTLSDVNAIYCGGFHCFGLTSCGDLYGWGDNEHGQLGHRYMSCHYKPVLIENLDKIVFKKINCGERHSLLLSNENTIYSVGRNNCGQLGIGNTEDQNRMTKIDNSIRFVDIYANTLLNISAALSQTGKYYIWGECGEDVITTPKETDFTSFNEISAKYSRNSFIPHSLNLE